VEGWKVMYIDVMIVDISCQLVRNISLGTGEEELGFGLKVVKMMLEFCNSSRNGGDNVSEVVASICGGTKWITKESV
jgi:translation elongation factor EF-1beta